MFDVLDVQAFVFVIRMYSFYCESAYNARRARYSYGICPSVCPMPVLCLYEWTCHQTYWRSGRGIIL